LVIAAGAAGRWRWHADRASRPAPISTAATAGWQIPVAVTARSPSTERSAGTTAAATTSFAADLIPLAAVTAAEFCVADARRGSAAKPPNMAGAD
jgi:hypothetical protein